MEDQWEVAWETLVVPPCVGAEVAATGAPRQDEVVDPLVEWEVVGEWEDPVAVEWAEIAVEWAEIVVEWAEIVVGLKAVPVVVVDLQGGAEKYTPRTFYTLETHLIC